MWHATQAADVATPPSTASLVGFSLPPLAATLADYVAYHISKKKNRTITIYDDKKMAN